MAFSTGEDSASTKPFATFRASIRAASSMDSFLNFTVSVRVTISLDNDTPAMIIARRILGSEIKGKSGKCRLVEKNKEFIANAKNLDYFISS
jgi:hypothetical protein